MSEQKRKRRPWLRVILITILVLVVILGAVYWYVATEKFSDTKDRQSDYSISALDLIHEFEKDSKAANTKYKDKILTVNGRVSELEAPDTSTVNIKFVEPVTSSLAIFAFQDQHLSEGKGLKVGDSISIKASFSEGVFSEVLQSTKIDFKRAALNKP